MCAQRFTFQEFTLPLHQKPYIMRIKYLAKAKGIKIADLAAKVGVTREMCSRQINSDNITVQTAQRYADALSVPLWQIFTSPEDVQGTPTFICPHCGKPIHITLTQDGTQTP